MNGLEKEYGDRIDFQRVNILDPESRPVMEKYGFSTSPEIYLVDARGEIVAFWDSLESADELRTVFDKLLARPGSPPQ